MIPIAIDTSGVSAEFSLSKSEVEDMIDYVVKETVSEFARNWEQEVRRNLSSMRNRYIQNIVVIDEGKMKGAVVLTGQLSNMIEDGSPPYDLKEGLLNSPKAKSKKDGGKYITVPFRLAAPTSIGESEVFSGKIPEEIHATLKEKEANIAIEGGMRTEGLKESEMPDKYKAPTTRKTISIPKSKAFEEYKRKTSLFTGATRIEDAVTGQSRVVSFRRVSDKSDPDSWTHPGFSGLKLAEAALESTDIPMVVDRSIDNFLAKIGF